MGGYGRSWYAKAGTPVKGLRAVVTGHARVRIPWFDGYWSRVGTGAGIAGMDRLTLMRWTACRWRQER